MKKTYQTKNRLIYRELGILETLRYLQDKHKKIYGIDPKEVYLPHKEYHEYVGRFKNSLSKYAYFRGMKVKKLI